jgi:hypothetical protein
MKPSGPLILHSVHRQVAVIFMPPAQNTQRRAERAEVGLEHEVEGAKFTHKSIAAYAKQRAPTKTIMKNSSQSIVQRTSATPEMIGSTCCAFLLVDTITYCYCPGTLGVAANTTRASTCCRTSCSTINGGAASTNISRRSHSRPVAQQGELP